MREMLDVIALVVGYWTLLCVAGLLTLLVGSVVCQALRPTPRPAPKPVDVWKMGPFLNPHPQRHTTLHVDTDDIEQAWRVIGGRAS